MNTDKQYDAILVHVYWLSNIDGDVKLSTRSNLVAASAASLYLQGKVKNIVITGGKIWGKEYPSVARLMANELTNTFTIPQEHIFIKDIALNTSQEIDEFLKIAEKMNWQSLLDLASKKHFWTISKLYMNKGVKDKVEFVNMEDVLLKGNNDELIKRVKKLMYSKYEFNYILYELVIRLVLFIDPQYTLLGKIAGKERIKKTFAGLLPFLPMDEYQL